MTKINITVTGVDGGVKVFPARDALQTSGDYLVIQGVGHMNFIPLSQIESLDFFNEQESEVLDKKADEPV